MLYIHRKIHRYRQSLFVTLEGTILRHTLTFKSGFNRMNFRLRQRQIISGDFSALTPAFTMIKSAEWNAVYTACARGVRAEDHVRHSM